MANFTDEQLQEIRSSEDFAEFIKKYEQEKIDKSAILKDYLGNELNRAKWKEKFSAASKEKTKGISESSIEEKLAKAEHELEVYLHTIYADEILQKGKDLPENFWETEEYQKWKTNYKDKTTLELKDKIKKLHLEINDKKTVLKSQSRYVPDIDAALLQHGFNDEKFVNEIYGLLDKVQGTGSKAEHFYEAIINAYESNAYNKGSRKNLNEELIKSEEDILIAENVMKALGFNIEPGKTNYQSENSAKVGFPVREQKIDVVVIPVDKKKVGVIDDIIPTPPVDDIIPTPPKGEPGKKIEDDKRDIKKKEQQSLGRDRSANSDANEFLLDKLRLQVLLDMEKINKEIFDEAIKNPTNAIEKLNEKLPLDEKEQAVFENKMTDYMLENDELFELLPPLILAQKYEEIKRQAEVAANQDEKADISKENERIAKLANRMDTLSAYFYNKENLFFADVTNVSDTYDGYMKMFEVREKDLDKEKDASKLHMIKANREKLDEMIGDYDKDWNLQEVKDADKLDKRFDELSDDLEKTEVDEETLKLISNFKFLNEKGEVEPQFTDEKGYKVAKDSKLETMIRIAKQNVLMENLNTDIKKEDLSKAVNEKLYEVLYAAHVSSQVEKGIKEDPNQFTKKEYLDKFISDLSNVEKPMSVTHTAYDATIDGCINSVGGFAHRLGAKIGKDKPVVIKLFKPLKDLDKRSSDRTEKKVDKRAYRIEMLKRTAKGGASAFLVSGAITVVGTMAATDATLTAATLGMNKAAGMVIGSALAIGMTMKQIKNWKKDRKARGEDTKWWKDRSMLMSVGTAALGAAAVVFAATGNPGVAQALGLGALALGSTNMAINTIKEGKEAGVSGLEGFGWAMLQTAVNFAAGYGGRAAANYGIDVYNQHHENNRVFQHEVTTEKTESVTVRDVEIGYKEGTTENAQKILKGWYVNDQELLQQRVSAIEAYNMEHGTNIDPHRYLLAAHDAGALSADNNFLHVQGGEDVHTNGNHKVLGAGWSNATGVSQDTVKMLAASVSGSGINITPESLSAFEQIDKFISPENQVGHVSGAPFQNDGVLGYNAETTESGRMVSSENGNKWTTYADHSGPYEEKIVERIETRTIAETKLVRNETNLGVGMFGVRGRLLNNVKLKERIGSLKDKIFSKIKGDKSLSQESKPKEAKEKDAQPKSNNREQSIIAKKVASSKESAK